MRNLFETRPEAPLKQLDVVTRALARAQKAGVGHHYGSREIAQQVAPEHAFCRP